MKVQYDKLSIIIDISSDVIEKLNQYKKESSETEKAGYLIGYENSITGNITISNIFKAIPSLSNKFSINFKLKENNIFSTIKKPYGFIGTWHTHPETSPNPSKIDFYDWNKILKFNQKSVKHLVFIIIGYNSIKIYLGDCKKRKIYEEIKTILS